MGLAAVADGCAGQQRGTGFQQDYRADLVFKDTSLRSLMYRDWAEFEAFSDALAISTNLIEIRTHIRRFVSFLEMLIQEVSKRSIFRENQERGKDRRFPFVLNLSIPLSFFIHTRRLACSGGKELPEDCRVCYHSSLLFLFEGDRWKNLGIEQPSGNKRFAPGGNGPLAMVEESARRIFDQYGYLEIRTPIIEPTELFARGIGGDTDIVGKEMYTFIDQSNRSVTLRPEATASVVRAYVQNTMYRGGGITKLYYIGPMFRHEKKQKGRWRQFYQIGAEALGSDHPAVDAEMIEMALWFLESLGVEARLLINSVGCGNCRPPYIEILRLELRNICRIFAKIAGAAP